jgi:Tfp pilus assembly protein PilF
MSGVHGLRGVVLPGLLLLAAAGWLTGTAEKPAPLTAEQRLKLEKEVAEKEATAKQAEAAEDFDQARQARKEVLALRTKLHGAQDWRVTDARLVVKKDDLLARLSADQRQKLRIATEKNNRGVKLIQAGKHQKALPLFREALALRQMVLGEEHPDTAVSYSNLASNLKKQGRYADAEPLNRKALAINQKVLGDQHPQTALSFNNLGDSLHAQGKYADAESLSRKALSIRQKVLGEEHADTAQSYSNLASALNGQGKYADAESLCRKALPILQKVLGEEHPVTALSYNNLATDLNAQGKYADAEILFRKALAIRQIVLGEGHPDTALSYNNLASNLRSQGRYADAEPLNRKALAINQKVLGDEHPQTADTYHNMARCLSDQGKDAESLYRKVLAIRQKVLGAEHPDTTVSYISLAMELNHQGKSTEAETLLRQALAIDEKLLGEQHPSIAVVYNNLGGTLQGQGKYADAEILFRKALTIRQSVLGEGHPDTALSYNNLAFNLHAQGRYAEALPPARAAGLQVQTLRRHASFSGLEQSTFAAKTSRFRLLAALLVRSGQPADAWQALEDNLARGLREDLFLRSNPLLPEADRRRADDLQDRLDTLDKRLLALAGLKAPASAQQRLAESLSRERNQLLIDLRRLQAKLREQYSIAGGKIYDLAHVQKQVPADAALLAWVDVYQPPTKTESTKADPQGDHWACLVRASGPPVWVHLPGSGPQGAWGPADNRLPQKLRPLLHGHGSTADWRNVAGRLAAQRLQPLDLNQA